MRKIELLAPARTAQIGIEAINHGADAVYIGAPAFGARAAAVNSVADIARLADYAHQYGAKAIVTLNTILTDQELIRAERLTWQLHEAGVDALIIQDLGLLQLDLPPIELHASTQTDNRTLEKVRLMRDLGMKRVVMARELSVSEIRAIHEAVPDVELECFIHGALCVCISGQCYMSSALTGRSANRGECAQPCRLPMDLLSADGRETLVSQRHLLSLRDMNRSAQIEQLLDAGVTSLKIEGRLKDAGYVKNVVAYYRRLLDGILERRADTYAQDSYGHCTYTFEPCLAKSFNRGFTSYFAEGEREPMWNFDSPKSQGEEVGTVVNVQRDSFTYRGQDLHNGDGLAVGSNGFRLNRFDKPTSTCYPLDGRSVCRLLHRGDRVFRNADTAFDQLLEKPSAERRMLADIRYVATADGLTVSMESEGGATATVSRQQHFDTARTDQTDNVGRQLSKLGGTVFELRKMDISGAEYFVPSSLIAELRRSCVEELAEACRKMQSALRKSKTENVSVPCPSGLRAEGVLPSSYLANVMNGKARQLLQSMGVRDVEDAFEIQESKEGMVMQTRHCLKYAFGQCPRFRNPAPETLDRPCKIGNQLMLKIGNRKFILKFGCQNDCISKIFTIFAP